MPDQNPTDAHHARERAAAIARGDVDLNDMTSAEVQAAMRAIPNDVAKDYMSRSWSTSNDGPPVELDGQAMLDAQEARHRVSRVQKLITPFEDAYLTDVQNYGVGNPNVMSVKDRAINAMSNAKTEAERAQYREAYNYLREQDKKAAE